MALRLNRRTQRFLFRVLPQWLCILLGSFAIVLLGYLTVRDLGQDGPIPHASTLIAPSPFATAACCLQQLKFLAGLLLFFDRVRDSATCHASVRDAMVDLRHWKKRLSHSEASRVHGVAAEDNAGKPSAWLAGGGAARETEAGKISPRVLHRNPAAYGASPPANCSSIDECGLEWVVYATSCNLGVNRLGDQLREKKIPFTLLGKGQGWRGWGQRIRIYHNYLSLLPANRLVILSDAEDVIMAPGVSAEELILRFKERTSAVSPILVSAEYTCWPEGQLWDRYSRRQLVYRPKGMRDPRCALRTERMDEHQTRDVMVDLDTTPVLERRGAGGVAHGGSGPLTDHIIGLLGCRPGRYHAAYFRFQYLNAGTLMGRAGDIVQLLARIYKDDCVDDQLELSRAYLRPDWFWVEKVEVEWDAVDGEAAAAGRRRRDGADEDKEEQLEAVGSAMLALDKAEAETRSAAPSSTIDQPFRPDNRTGRDGGRPSQRVLDARKVLGVAATRFEAHTVWAEDVVEEARRRAHAASTMATPPPKTKAVRFVRRQGNFDTFTSGDAVDPLAAVPHTVVSRTAPMPLLGLDFDNDVFAALYGVHFNELVLVNGTGGGAVYVPDTKGWPAILHQNGNKVENRVLDEVAKVWGLPFSQSAIDRSHRRSGRSMGKVGVKVPEKTESG
ncbi:hypothetical protein HDU96_008884 [Phlyctochytrium bullatum]|nr:hypothetical protein HDU96_008884 [Phlyctochytrium bullatum]